MLVRAPTLRWWLVPCLAIGVAGPAAAGPPPPPAAGSGDTAKKGAAAAPPSPGQPVERTSPPPKGSPPATGTKPTSSSLPPPPPGKPGEASGAAPSEPERPPVDLRHTWSRSRGGAASPRFVREGEQRVEIANPEGYYSGVSVEGNHVPPFPAAKMGTKPALLTWTGFERTSAGSRVFFEVSAAVATKLTVKGATLTLRMVNTKINVKNNTRHLDLRYFKTPVSSVKVKRAGKDTVATIVLKRGAEPRLSMVDGKAGYKLVVLEFGEPGSDAPAPAPPP